MSDADKRYTKNWHNEADKRLKHLAKFAGHPINVLEIGVHEGRSTCWMLDNIATHPESKIIAVDPFGYSGGSSEAEIEALRFGASVWGDPVAIKSNFLHNTAEYNGKVSLFEWPSDEFFQHCRPGFAVTEYSIIVVDGGHSAPQAAKDLLHSWDLLADGGMLVFDDYEWKGDKSWECDGPKRAMDAFLSILPKSDYRVAYKGYIVILEKI